MDKTQIDREVSPILASLLATDQGRNDCVFQLFCWLKNPLRTSEEVTYVIGNLADNVYDIMKEHFPNYLNQGRFWNTLCATVANAIRYREDLWGRPASTFVMVAEKHDGFYRISSEYICQHLHLPLNNKHVWLTPLLQAMVELNDCLRIILADVLYLG